MLTARQHPQPRLGGSEGRTAEEKHSARKRNYQGEGPTPSAYGLSTGRGLHGTAVRGHAQQARLQAQNPRRSSFCKTCFIRINRVPSRTRSTGCAPPPLAHPPVPALMGCRVPGRRPCSRGCGNRVTWAQAAPVSRRRAARPVAVLPGVRIVLEPLCFLGSTNPTRRGRQRGAPGTLGHQGG